MINRGILKELSENAAGRAHTDLTGTETHAEITGVTMMI